MITKTMTCLHCGESFFSEVQKKEAFCCLGCEKIYLILNQGLAALSQDSATEQSIESYQSLLIQDRLRIYIDGIHCISCLKFIEKLPGLISGIEEVDYNYFENTIDLKINTEKFQITPLVQLLYFIGYQFHFVQDTSDLEKLHKKELKTLLNKLAVAGFSASNIMILAVSIYAGLSGPMANTFHWISFVLFLPILFYSATSFYQGAWRSLQTFQPSIDLPITIAMLSGFVLSTYQLILKSDAVYFDSLSTFLFLILVSRYLTKKWLYQNKQKSQLSDLVGVNFVNRISNQQKSKIHISNVQIGDLIEVTPQQNICFDGVLISETARLNTSLMTGESYPRRFHKGMMILAGFQNLMDSCLIQVTAIDRNTELGKTFQKIESMDFQKIQIQKKIHQISHILLLTVLGLGILTLVALPNLEGMQRFLALMIVACPCALAFGTPLALLGSFQEAFKKNMIIQSASVFDQISQIKKIYFDKTGTLTTGQLTISHFEPQEPNRELKSIILGLEINSQHPIANVLRNEFSDIQPVAIHSTNPLCGFFNNDYYEIKAHRENVHQGKLSFQLFKNNSHILTCYLQDQIKDDAISTVQQLQKKYSVGILSGDRKNNVELFAKEVGIESKNAKAELTPEQKAEFIDSHCIMIGDGANDALSLSKAGIGIATSGALALSLKACDVYLKNPNLTSILDLIQIIQRGKNKIYRNVAISLFYNITSGILAILGYMNPLWAAVLMPLISITLLVSSLMHFSKTSHNKGDL